MTDGGVEVPPLSRSKIRQVACRVRAFVRDIQGEDTPRFPIFEFLDVVLPRIDEDFTLEVCALDEMGDNHGLTIPEEKIIRIREDVYLGARAGQGRDRMTMAHELGHFILHSGCKITLARTIDAPPPPAYKNSEWQAKAFAGELLISHQHLQGCCGPEDLVKQFGVSLDAACYQWEKLKDAKLI